MLSEFTRIMSMSLFWIIVIAATGLLLKYATGWDYNKSVSWTALFWVTFVIVAFFCNFQLRN